MSRYFTRARKALWVSDDFDEPAKAADHVPSVPDHEARFTGLLDAHGEEIWEAPRAIGFGRRSEW